MAGRFSNLIHNPQTWNNQTCKSVLTPAERQTAEQIIQARAGATQEEFNAAAERVKGLGVDLKAIDAGSPPNSSLVLVIAGAWAFTTGVPALIAAILFRGGVLLRGLGLALVTRDGVPARRWRVLARGMIVWMPAILAFTLLPSALLPRRLLWSMLVAIVVTYVGAALWSLRSTQRGVQDWIARTWMVPR